MPVLSWLPLTVLGVTLLAASVSDLRSRQVPLWLMLGSLVLAVVIAAAHGTSAVVQAAIGLAVGFTVPLPLVLLGGLGGADALLLGTVGAWVGWRLALWTAWWAAIAGAIIALVLWRLGRRTFAYVPAIAVGFLLAILA
ncbi:MAG: prepilin peptidase [Chloroflexota bacterium]|nr:prepilin peptidase [Chloroflexota bacterium]